MTAVVRHGEVWLADLDKTRPVIVLTRDPFGRLLHSVIVAPITSTIRGLSTEVSFGRDDGIRHPSVANLDNVQLLARDRFLKRIGRAQPATMKAVCAALSVAVDCGPTRNAVSREDRERATGIEPA